MTIVDAPPESQQRTYGNWRRGRRPGLFGLGPYGTGLAFVAMVCATGSTVLSAWLALAVVIVSAVVLTPMALRWHGQSGMHILIGHLMWWRGRRRRQHIYLSGLASPVSRPHRLPGILAKSQLWEVETGLREPLGVVIIPQSRHYSVTLRCQTEGLDLVDQPVLDQRVARMSLWLSTLCRDPMLEQAQIIVETTPDHGLALAAEVTTMRAEHSPPAARTIMDEVVASYPVGAAQVETFVTLTFKPPVKGRWSHEAMCAEISSRLPSLIASLHGAGAATVSPMSGEEVASVVAAAYNPVAAAVSPVRLAAAWSDAGPVASQEAWDHYRHDGAISRTWSMQEAPRGTVHATSYSRVTDPDPRVLCKRVAIIYRPYSPGAAAILVERDRKDALFEANKKRQATARDAVDVLATAQAAHDEATGAGVIRFSVMATVTVRTEAELDDAQARLMTSAAEARLLMRCMYRSQAAAFAANLPAGVVLAAHASIPF